MPDQDASRAKSSRLLQRMPKYAGIQSTSRSENVIVPSTNWENNFNPTARTNISANGSQITGSVCRLATARAAATSVAVAPTLVLRSQLTSSVRAMLVPLNHLAPERVAVVQAAFGCKVRATAGTG